MYLDEERGQTPLFLSCNVVAWSNAVLLSMVERTDDSSAVWGKKV
jgi:hypothetical protein